MIDVERPQVWRELVWWIGHGAVAGVLAGVLFIMFQMLVAAFQTAGEGFFLPLRASATLFAGPDAMQPDCDDVVLWTADGWRRPWILPRIHSPATRGPA